MKSISYLLGCMLLILCWACDKDSIEEQSPVLKTKAESIPEGLTITNVGTYKDNYGFLALQVSYATTQEFCDNYSYVELGYSTESEYDMSTLRIVEIGKNSSGGVCYFSYNEYPHITNLWIGARGLSQLEDPEQPGHYLPSRTNPNYTYSRLESHWATYNIQTNLEEGDMNVSYIEVTVYMHFCNKNPNDSEIHEGVARAFIGQGAWTENDADEFIEVRGKTGDVVAVTKVIPLKSTVVYVYSDGRDDIPPVGAPANIYTRIDATVYI